MTDTFRPRKHPGTSPLWANLPRRKCDDCGKSYKPVRPVKENERGFCTPNCRKSYHKHGGAYRKLKVEMKRMVEKELQKIRLDLFRSLSPLADKIEDHIRGSATAHCQLAHCSCPNHTAHNPTIGETTSKARREFANAISQALSPAR